MGIAIPSIRLFCYAVTRFAGDKVHKKPFENWFPAWTTQALSLQNTCYVGTGQALSAISIRFSAGFLNIQMAFKVKHLLLIHED